MDTLLGSSLTDLLDGGARAFNTELFPLPDIQAEVTALALSFHSPQAGSLPAYINARIVETRSIPLIDLAVFDVPEPRSDESALLAAQRSVEEAETRTRVLQNAATAFGLSDSVEDLAIALEQITREDIGATTAAVFLNDRPARLLAGTVPFDTASFPDGPPGGWISSEARAWSHLGAAADSDVGAALNATGLQSALIQPLLRGREVVGSLACFFSQERDMDPYRIDLVAALCRQAAQVLARLQLQAQLAAIALHDPLTGLGNRALLRSHISSSVQTATTDPQPLALIFVDLDDFKAINDELGHSAGDAVLATVASRITNSVRSGDLVCRFGGDEFIVVCQNTTQDEALTVAERIRTEIKDPILGDGWTSSLTASVGVTIHPATTSHTVTGADLLRTADQAMYRSKNHGKDQVTLINHP